MCLNVLGARMQNSGGLSGTEQAEEEAVPLVNLALPMAGSTVHRKIGNELFLQYSLFSEEVIQHFVYRQPFVVPCHDSPCKPHLAPKSQHIHRIPHPPRPTWAPHPPQELARVPPEA